MVRTLMNVLRRLSLCALLLMLSTLNRAAELRLNLNHSGTNASLQLSGDVGTEYLIESAGGSADHFTPVTSFIFTDPSRLWKDAIADTGNRFFRARAIDPALVQFATNFRLIDQNGVSRELYYYLSLDSLKAIVITFADGNYSAFAPKIAALKSSFPSSSAFFWTIETGVNNTRSNILKQATAAAINWPVYQDPMQLVTRSYDAHFNGETFVISRETVRVVYRGVIDDPTTNYVRAALNNIIAGQQVMTTRLEPTAGTLAARAATTADYATVIAPLLQTKCVICHSPGNIAPFEITKYDDVAAHNLEMKEEILAARMPPWHADPLYGKFKSNTSLSEIQKAQLIDWIDAGMPRGAGPDPLLDVPPPPPKWPVELGEPDQIVTVPEQSIPAFGTQAYRYIYVNATNTEGKWLKAAMVRPRNKKVVHHYIVWQGHSASAMLSGVALYAPGHNDGPFPDGTGIYLPPNCDLTFNLHYTSDRADETDQPELGLWYADTPPAKTLKTVAALNLQFTFGPQFGLPTLPIPAGNPEFELAATGYVVNSSPGFSAFTFSAPARIYSFSPHMHFRGLRMRFELTLPGSSTKQILCSVPKYDFDWQTIYELETPLDVPPGARIDVIGAFDNSAQNIYNPDPTIPVKWGEQSWDEMFIGYFTYSDR
jgi:hypothetical protein